MVRVLTFVDLHVTSVFLLIFSCNAEDYDLLRSNHKSEDISVLAVPSQRPTPDLAIYRQQIRKLPENKKFTDLEFSQALQIDQDEYPILLWRRPTDFNSDAVVIGKLAHGDVMQGQLGDCWLVSSIVCYLYYGKKDLVTKQDFSKGILHFTLHDYDGWKTIIIDDKLPIIMRFNHNYVHYMKSRDHKEFYPSLLEKAVAKQRFGKYRNLDGGMFVDAFTLIQGGVTHKLHMGKKISESTLFSIMKKAHFLKALIGVSGMREPKSDNHGLRDKHAYSCFGADFVTFLNGTRLQLIHLRNPYGDETGEFYGTWSSQSDAWDTVGESDRNRYKYIINQKDTKGEFMMSLSEFMRHFTHVHLGFTSMEDFFRVWKLEDKISDQVPGTFFVSPRYKGTFEETPSSQVSNNCGDPNKKLAECSQQITLNINGDQTTEIYGLITLQQKFTLRKNKEKKEYEHPQIAIRIYKINQRVKLVKGKYVIILDSFNVGIRGRYATQIYLNCKFTTKQLN